MPKPSPSNSKSSAIRRASSPRLAYVPLTSFDLARAVERLHESPSDFAQLTPASSADASPYPLPLISNGSGQPRPCLLTLQQRTNGSCVFSRYQAGCAMRGCKPTFCQAYPYLLQMSRPVRLSRALLCPPAPDGIGTTAQSGILSQQRRELEAYNHLVKEWNAKAGSEQAFWAFIMERSQPENGRASPASKTH